MLLNEVFCFALPFGIQFGKTRGVLNDGFRENLMKKLVPLADGATETCYREAVRTDGIWCPTKVGTDDTAVIER